MVAGVEEINQRIVIMAKTVGTPSEGSEGVDEVKKDRRAPEEERPTLTRIAGK